MELQPQRLDPTSIIECHVRVLTEQLICVPTKQPTHFSPVLTNPVEFLYFSTPKLLISSPKKHQPQNQPQNAALLSSAARCPIKMSCGKRAHHQYPYLYCYRCKMPKCRTDPLRGSIWKKYP